MGKTLVHCSYHKCLTVYFKRVFSNIYNRPGRLLSGYKHFMSWIDAFHEELDNYTVASINNHALDLSRLGDDVRITRFVRDPRDLVVSGYFYHKNNPERWCNIVNPTHKDFSIVNGVVPDDMGPGQTYTSYLQGLSKENGLIAEIDFRHRHFESMRQWPESDPRIRIYRYEDILGNERKIFHDIFCHYGISFPRRALGTITAERFSANRQVKTAKHIRNPASGQWREHFTDRVNDYFDRRYADILSRYGYD